MIHIRGGTVIDPASGKSFIGDLVLEKGRIADVVLTGEADLSFLSADKTGSCRKASDSVSEKDTKIFPGACEGREQSAQDEEIDARGLIVTTGLVDAHVHFRDPGQTQKEDILTGAEAAKHGGFTSVIMMGNTIPHPDTSEVISYMLKKGRETGIRVYTSANVTKGMQGKELSDMKALKEAGAVLFTDDGLPLKDANLFRRACAEAAALHMLISLHEEDPSFVYDAGVNEGKIAAVLGLRGASREAEISLVERDIKIAAEEGAEIMIQHISCAETVELVRAARKTNKKIHAEATPHHFTLTEEAVLRYGTLAKMNPPLRTEADRQAIIAGLCDGTIEQIATDHAPHTKAEKDKPFREAPSGIIGLETALGLGVRELVRTGKMSLPQLIGCMSTAPARLSGIPGGVLAVGEPADLLIFDLRAVCVADRFFSKASNTPFAGIEMPLGIRYVFAAGQCVYSSEKQSI